MSDLVVNGAEVVGLDRVGHAAEVARPVPPAVDEGGVAVDVGPAPPAPRRPLVQRRHVGHRLLPLRQLRQRLRGDTARRW